MSKKFHQRELALLTCEFSTLRAKFGSQFVLSQEHVRDAALDGKDATGLAADELTLNNVNLRGE